MKDNIVRADLFSAHNAPPEWRPVRAEIDMAKIPADDNAGGLIFAIGAILVFLIGIPAIRPLFLMAVLGGVAIAVILHFFRRGLRGSTAPHF